MSSIRHDQPQPQTTRDRRRTKSPPRRSIKQARAARIHRDSAAQQHATNGQNPPRDATDSTAQNSGNTTRSRDSSIGASRRCSSGSGSGRGYDSHSTVTPSKESRSSRSGSSGGLAPADMCTADPHLLNRCHGAMDGSDSTDHLLMTWGANANGPNVGIINNYNFKCSACILLNRYIVYVIMFK